MIKKNFALLYAYKTYREATCEKKEESQDRHNKEEQKEGRMEHVDGEGSQSDTHSESAQCSGSC